MTTILLAEDHELTLELTANRLLKRGYNVITARNGLEAVEAFHAQKEVDLVILDVMMPFLNGVEGAARIRKKCSVVPIILLTAISDIEMLKKNSFKIDYILQKPYTKKHFFEIVEQYTVMGEIK